MVGTTAAAQLNVRIDRATKAAGDSAIASMGISVTDFVRKLWEKLAESGQDRTAIERAVLGAEASLNPTSEVSAQHTQRLEVLAQMRSLRDDWMLSIGLDESNLLGGEPVVGEDGHHPDREHALDALLERVEERDVR